AQGRDDHAGPKPGAVLADPPALLLIPAFGCRQLHLSLRLASLNNFGRVKAGEVLADDLVGLVALNALRSGVPTDHPPFGVQHEDGVVWRASDQEADPLLAGPYLGSPFLYLPLQLAMEVTLQPLQQPTLGNVPEHQHDADDFALGIADRSAAVVNRDFGAVLGDQGGVIRQPDHHAFPDDPRDRTFDRLAGLLVHDAENFVQGPTRPVLPTRHGLGHPVHQGDTA